MKTKLYFCLVILGAVLPLSVFVPFILTHGFDVGLFLEQLWQTPVSRFFALDVVVSGVTLWVFVVVEGRRLGMKRLWIYFACTFLVGVSLGLPLFLLCREVRQKALTMSATL